jgi:hypothetical protein
MKSLESAVFQLPAAVASCTAVSVLPGIPRQAQKPLLARHLKWPEESAMTMPGCKRVRNQLFLNVCVFLTCLLVMTISAVAQNLSTGRPANVPPEYVVTPFGYMHPSCVTHVGQGERVGHNMLQHADGTMENIPACQYPRYKAKGEVVEPTSTEAPKPPEISWDWVEAVTDFYSTNLGQESSTWVVPPAPTSHDGQTDYFFPGIGNIMQPVMGWGADFPTNWGIASWVCCSPAAESTAIQVNPGDLISGTITQNCSLGSSSCDSWKVVTTDVTTGQSTTLGAEPTQGDQYEAVGGVLEVYSIAQCSDYPPDGEIVYNSTFYDYNGNFVPNLTWSGGASTTDSPQCNYSAQATTQSQIVLTYGTVPNLNGAHTLTPQNATGLRLDDYYSGTGSGNPIDVYTVNNSGAQSWVFNNANVAPAGFYNLAVSYGAYCMTASGSTSGSLVQLDPCNGSSAQAWEAVTADNGYVLHPANNTSLCLDVQGDGTTAGTLVQAWTCNGQKNETWVLN